MYSHTFQFGADPPFTTGCTAVVDVKLFAKSLNSDGILIDICVAQQILHNIMAHYDHKNLDVMEEFQSPRRNTTVEVMAKAIYLRFVKGLQAHHVASVGAGQTGLRHVNKVEVIVKESDVAYAGYHEEFSEGLFAE